MFRRYPQSVFEGHTYTVSDGRIFILKYASATQVLIEFLSTGYRCWTRAGEIRKGAGIKDRLRPTVAGVGYLGVGPASRGSKAYHTWNNMLQRCYSVGYQKKLPYWEDCTVCSSWHDLQVFSRWYDENHVDGYDLDKDMKVKGNRVYGPDTCAFIPKEENRRARVGMVNNHWNGKPENNPALFVS